MKSILVGVISSLFICGVMYFLFIPKIKSHSYNEGYNKGMSKGLMDGKTIGMFEQKKYDDSITNSAKLDAELSEQIAKPTQPKAKNNYNVNYKMNGNEVGERIPNKSSE